MLFQLVPADFSGIKLEQLEFKLKKIWGFRNMQEKLEKHIFQKIVVFAVFANEYLIESRQMPEKYTKNVAMLLI